MLLKVQIPEELYVLKCTRGCSRGFVSDGAAQRRSKAGSGAQVLFGII